MLFSFANLGASTPVDWWKWRGDQGDGSWNCPSIAEDLTGRELRRLWKNKISPGYSGVTTSGNMVLTMDRPPQDKGEFERVLNFDLESGKKQWEFSYESNYHNLDYGKGPRASITVVGNMVYGLGAMGHAFCLDAKTGKKIWFRNLLREEKLKPPIWGFSASPEPLGDLILFHVGNKKNGNILALDQATGKKLWAVGDDEKAGYAPPLVLREHGLDFLICWGPNKIMGLPIGGGKEWWSFPYPVKYGVSIAKPIFSDGVIIVSGYWHGTRAIQLKSDSREASLLWSDETDLCGLMSQPLHRNGVCYLLDRRNGLTAFTMKTGEILWRDEHRLTAKDRNPHASLVWTDRGNGKALALNAEGELVFINLNPAKYKEYWRRQVTGETWSHPAFSKNKIFVRDDRSISCWQLPSEK